MRIIATALLAFFLGVHLQVAYSQDSGMPQMGPPIAPGDMINYCIYAGLIYSVGSQMCVARGSPPLYCDQPVEAGGKRARAIWTTNQPPATLNCAELGSDANSSYTIRRQP
jgi:hypothetical protein